MHLHLQDYTHVRRKHVWHYVELYSTVHFVTAQPNLNLTQLKAGVNLYSTVHFVTAQPNLNLTQLKADVTFCYSPP